MAATTAKPTPKRNKPVSYTDELQGTLTFRGAHELGVKSPELAYVINRKDEMRRDASERPLASPGSSVYICAAGIVIQSKSVRRTD